MRRQLTVVALIVGLALVGGVGCDLLKGISPEQVARIQKLGEDNDALTRELASLVSGVKEGKVSTVDALAAIVRVKAQLEKNLAELEEIKKSGANTGTLFGALLGLFGRSAAHGLRALPIPGPLGIGINALLTIVLGGSESKTPASTDPPPKPA